jgi:apolipoprotein D and lipocalin family protein
MINKMKITALVSFIFLVITVNAFSQRVQTVKQLDIDRYLGLWYNVASYRGGFHKGCRCTTAEYDVVPNKKYLSITNRCIRFKHNRSKIITTEGKAYYGEDSDNAELKIQYHWPFRHTCYVIGLADDYSWAVIGRPGQNHLWILSRDPAMPLEVNGKILELIANQGYDVNKIVKTPQNCDTPK